MSIRTWFFSSSWWLSFESFCDQSHCQDIHSQSQNGCFQDFQIFGNKYSPPKNQSKQVVLWQMSSVSYAELRDFSWAMLVLWFLWLHWSRSDISWNLVWVKMWSNGWAGDQAFLLVGTNSPPRFFLITYSVITCQSWYRWNAVRAPFGADDEGFW